MVSMYGTPSRAFAAALFAAMLAGFIPVATASTATDDAWTDDATTTENLDEFGTLGASASCSVPCGMINPIITLKTEIPTPIKASDVADLPKTSTVSISFWWDFEQDGTGIPDDTEEMQITLSVTKQPDWIDAKLDQTVCSFMINPAENDYPEVCSPTLTLDVKRLPMLKSDIEYPNNRIMLFATSEEKGTFQKSYGVKDMRFVDDGELGAAFDTAEEASALAPFALAVPVAALALAAVRRRD